MGMFSSTVGQEIVGEGFGEGSHQVLLVIRRLTAQHPEMNGRKAEL